MININTHNIKHNAQIRHNKLHVIIKHTHRHINQITNHNIQNNITYNNKHASKIILNIKHTITTTKRNNTFTTQHTNINTHQKTHHLYIHKIKHIWTIHNQIISQYIHTLNIQLSIEHPKHMQTQRLLKKPNNIHNTHPSTT